MTRSVLLPNRRLVTINLPAETAQRLKEAAARRGETLEAYLGSVAASYAIDVGGAVPAQTAEEWVAEFRAWAAGHAAVAHFVDDSRESIYEGRATEP